MTKSPSLGRFAQQDPSRQEADTYSYVNCNPINASDPNGTDGACEQEYLLIGLLATVEVVAVPLSGGASLAVELAVGVGLAELAIAACG